MSGSQMVWFRCSPTPEGTLGVPGDTGGKVLPASGEKRPGMLLHIPLCSGPPHNKEWPAPKDDSAEGKEPCFRRITEIHWKLKNKNCINCITVQWQHSEWDLNNSEKQTAVQQLPTEFHTRLLNNTIHYLDPRERPSKMQPWFWGEQRKMKIIAWYKTFQRPPRQTNWKIPNKKTQQENCVTALILNRP